nr:hypothetical protein [Tanacetum cinerariifolium]
MLDLYLYATSANLTIVGRALYEVGESLSAAAARPAGGFKADYSFVATVDREIMRDPEREGLARDPTQPELLEEAGGSA